MPLRRLATAISARTERCPCVRAAEGKVRAAALRRLARKAVDLLPDAVSVHGMVGKRLGSLLERRHFFTQLSVLLLQLFERLLAQHVPLLFPQVVDHLLVAPVGVRFVLEL
jgi:hypothetical protein